MSTGDALVHGDVALRVDPTDLVPVALREPDISERTDRNAGGFRIRGRDRVVGELVMKALKEMDQVAYIRYAIVYLGLDDLHAIRDEINHLLAS